MNFWGTNLNDAEGRECRRGGVGSEKMLRKGRVEEPGGQTSDLAVLRGRLRRGLKWWEELASSF